MSIAALAHSIEAAAAPLPSFDVHCIEHKEDVCSIQEEYEVDGSFVLNIVNADGWKNVTKFEIDNASRMQRIPSGIFERFPKLTEFRMYTHLQLLQRNDFEHAAVLKEFSIAFNDIEVLHGRTFELADELTRINIGFNPMHTIEDNTFSGLDKLTVLNLDNNRLTRIGRNTFAGAPNLEILNLMKNQIEIIEEGAINFPKLRNLLLTSNKLIALPNGFFFNTPKLEVLYLSENRLQSIDDSLYSLFNLETLHLYSNSISDIDVKRLGHLAMLSDLQLSQNRIEELDFQAVAKLPSLKRLDLVNCNVVIAKNTSELVGVAPLTWLDLGSNWLEDSDILKQLKVFRKLENLNLRDNRLRELDGLSSLLTDFPSLTALQVRGNLFTCEYYKRIVATAASRVHVSTHGGEC